MAIWTIFRRQGEYHFPHVIKKSPICYFLVTLSFSSPLLPPPFPHPFPLPPLPFFLAVQYAWNFCIFKLLNMTETFAIWYFWSKQYNQISILPNEIILFVENIKKKYSRSGQLKVRKFLHKIWFCMHKHIICVMVLPCPTLHALVGIQYMSTYYSICKGSI